jgi:hypothetical protein
MDRTAPAGTSDAILRQGTSAILWRCQARRTHFYGIYSNIGAKAMESVFGNFCKKNKQTKQTSDTGKSNIQQIFKKNDMTLKSNINL